MYFPELPSAAYSDTFIRWQWAIKNITHVGNFHHVLLPIWTMQCPVTLLPECWIINFMHHSNMIHLRIVKLAWFNAKSIYWIFRINSTHQFIIEDVWYFSFSWFFSVMPQWEGGKWHNIKIYLQFLKFTYIYIK